MGPAERAAEVLGAASVSATAMGGPGLSGGLYQYVSMHVLNELANLSIGLFLCLHVLIYVSVWVLNR